MPSPSVTYAAPHWGWRLRPEPHLYTHTHIYICTGVFLLKTCSLSLGEGKGTPPVARGPKVQAGGVAAGAMSQPQPPSLHPNRLLPFAKNTSPQPSLCSGGAGTLLRCQTGSHWGDAGVRGDGEGVVWPGLPAIAPWWAELGPPLRAAAESRAWRENK